MPQSNSPREEEQLLLEELPEATQPPPPTVAELSAQQRTEPHQDDVTQFAACAYGLECVPVFNLELHARGSTQARV
ncbi:hypothetical protein O9K51_05658 [Purpureocillium lavendulum]|uniref:Uncharacterized protein n=1 Tax=Purpureocillium lavendulum TaxID=1247861 RepID=A0AB34FS65_9HYPO|nr:hypothetical protein O9K51_05658 [Purpureocillium lavendulum]